MKHSNIALLAIVTVYMTAHAICTSPMSGVRDWDIAADNVSITDAIEIKIFALRVNDFTGTFTMLDTILSKAFANVSLAEMLDSRVDILAYEFKIDLNTLGSIFDILEATQPGLDVSGTFTALAALQQTVCSKIELLNVDLTFIEQQVIDLTASEIDYAETIASQLAVLDQEVIGINSIIDALSFDIQFNDTKSLIDTIEQSLLTIDSNVDQLQATITNGFVGTFTALHVNLDKSCTIESLIDVIPMSFAADLNGTFTALQALEFTLDTIASVVDDLDTTLVTIQETGNQIISTFDLLSSKLSVIASKAESIATQDVLSFFDHTLSLLDYDFSILESLEVNHIFETSYTIESNLDVILGELSSQLSDVEMLDRELQTITSKVSHMAMDTTAISKLNIIDSNLDMQLNTAYALEQNLDVIITITSTADLVEALAQTILSKLSVIDDLLPTTASELDILQGPLHTVASKLDLLNIQVENNLDAMITIESRVDHIFDTIVIATGSLQSKLSSIDDQIDTIESKLSLDLFTGSLNNQAQELIGDFQATWTILDIIEQTLCTDQSLLEETASIAFSLAEAGAFDITGIFTFIESILQKENSADSKVDSTLILVDNLVSQQDAIAVEFTGVFTALDALFSTMQTVESTALDIKGKVSFPGTPIRGLPFTINTPGRYYLANNINTSSNVNQITINVSNVYLDFNNHTIRKTGGFITSAVVTAINLSNVQICNGAIMGFLGAITFSSGNSNHIVKNMYLSFNDPVGGPTSSLILPSTTNFIFSNCVLDRARNDASTCTMNNGGNLIFKKCSFMNSGGTQAEVRIDGNMNNIYIGDCVFQTSRRGIWAQGLASSDNNILVQRSYFSTTGNAAISGDSNQVLNNLIYVDNTIEAGSIGISMTNAPRGNFLRNTIINCSTNGISTTAGNCYFGFNTLIQNGTNVRESSGGSNTYLGNFAFNSTAAGNPDNTNYNFSGSATNITGKFATVSQTGSFSDRPTKWHNINMLP